MSDRKNQFPLGAALSIDALSADPVPLLARLREEEPVSYVSALELYMVTRYADVVTVLRDTDSYVVGTEHSLILDIFGEHMMTVEGDRHDHYKKPHRPFFLPGTVRSRLEPIVRTHTDALIDEFGGERITELRASLSSRLPILTMLSLFGLPMHEELRFRALYDDFELAVSNFTWDERIREKGKAAAAVFHDLMQGYLDEITAGRDGSGKTLLTALKNPDQDIRLSDEEIRHNAIIVFFGGISTVDALILNTLYALSLHPDSWAEVSADLALLPQAIDETIRWPGPVQSATRHVVRETILDGVNLNVGDTVNCMLAAANRDPEVFGEPDRFDIHRHNAQRHLGFALGSHHCLGSNLARAEARIAIERLFERLPNLSVDLQRSAKPTGYEFRQPRELYAAWD